MLDQKRLKDAEAAVDEAIRLNPNDADHYDLLARIRMARRRWQGALEAAEQGLALNPEHTGCTNLRAMALVNLGRKDEAAHTLHSALANDPENSLTHANQGWALMHQGDHVKALEHFREALRIDPENEWARIGIVESLKARHLIYRLMLRLFLWMGRKSTATRWAIIIAIVFGQQILAEVAGRHKALAPLIVPLLVLFYGFILLTWISSPLFNLLLRLNKFGRLALSREQRIESNWIGACFALAVVSLVASVVHLTDLTIFGMLYFGLLLLPLVVTFQQPAGRPRRTMAIIAGAIALLGLPILSSILFGSASPLGSSEDAFEYFRYFIYGSMLSTWVPALLGLRDSSR